MPLSERDAALAHALLARGVVDAARLQQLAAEAVSRGCPLGELLQAAGIDSQATQRWAPAQLDAPTVPGGPRQGGLRDEAPAPPASAWGGSTRTVRWAAAQPEAPTVLGPPPASGPPPSGGALPASEAPTLLDRPRPASEAPTRLDSPPPRRGPGSTAELPPGVASRIPQRIGPFETEELLGQGGMGAVFRARHATLQRPCALKVLLPGPFLSEDALERFVAEARTAARVSGHPNLVRIHDAGRQAGLAYIAMELVEGETLAQLLAAGELDARAGAELLVPVCAALEHVHEQGVIHRDIKPANILIDAEGRPRLSDFGIAKTSGQGGSLTMTGAYMGTPSYMAPEQAQDSKHVDARADVYGLGAVLYALLTGRPPHQGRSPVAVMASLVERDPPPPRQLNPATDPRLEAVCLRALARDPAARYASAAELGQALAEALAHPPAGARRPRGVSSGRLRTVPRRGARPARGGSPAWAVAPVLLGGGVLLAFLAGGAGPEASQAPAGEAPQVATRHALETPAASPPASSAALASETPAGAPAPAGSERLEAAPAGTSNPRPEGAAPAAPPALELPQRVYAREPAYVLSGSVDPDATLKVDGESPLVQANGSFALSLQLAPGEQVLRAVARRGELETVREVRIVLDTVPPQLSVEGSLVFAQAAPRVPVSLDEPVRALWLDDVPVWGAEAEPRQRCELRPQLGSGARRFVLRAEDLAGNQTRLEVELVHDPAPPRLEAAFARKGRRLVLRGRVEDATPVRLRWGQQAAFLDTGDTFEFFVNRRALEQPRVLCARDAAGNERRVMVTTRPRLLFDRARWADASEAEIRGEIAWVAFLLRKSYVLQGVERVACAGLRHWIATFRHKKLGIELNLLPGGRYLMGLRPEDEAAEYAFCRGYYPEGSDAPIHEAFARELPARPVRVRPFLLARRELLEREWDALKRGKPSQPSERQGPEYPIGDVSWNTARVWLKSAGGGLRLPSDAEWEYACRAGSTTRFFWGDEDDPSYRRGDELPPGKGQAPRRTDLATPRLEAGKVNAFGLVDMVGNAWEWCEDDALPWTTEPAGHEPRRARGRRGEFRVLRSASLVGLAPFYRSTLRARVRPDNAWPLVGLRVARGLDGLEAPE